MGVDRVYLRLWHHATCASLHSNSNLIERKLVIEVSDKLKFPAANLAHPTGLLCIQTFSRVVSMNSIFFQNLRKTHSSNMLIR
jgi:hypothetical protein